MVKRVAFWATPLPHCMCFVFFFLLLSSSILLARSFAFFLAFTKRQRRETCDGLERENKKKLAGRERFMLPSVRGRSRPRFSRNPAVDLKGWAHVLVAAPNASTSPAGAKEREKMMRERFALFFFFFLLLSRQRKGSDTQTAMLQGIYPAAQYAFKDSMIH